ncbi:ABC transporter substrate-binding protein [Desulfosarcina ovata]|nr:ABC transporter substrate-binding protein [Desulfosarcina ovata]
MRFKLNFQLVFGQWPLPVKIGILFFAWLIFITAFHYRLNCHGDDRRVVRMGYMPVVTNLAAPLLDHVSQSSPDIFFEAVKFSSFAEMAEALRNDHIQAAFIIAPLAVVLHQQGVDIKVVLIGNRHESTLVARKELRVTRIEDLTGRTIAVPMRYSGHNLCLLKAFEEKGLGGRIRLVEMNPPDMASALTTGALDAYFVGEPFAAQTVRSGDADVVARAEALWPNFICNLLVVKSDWIAANPSSVQKLVHTSARAGMWAKAHSLDAARIAADYWKQDVGLVEYALTIPKGRVIYDRFVPKAEELREIADLMARYHLIKHTDITGLVEDRFARSASIADIGEIDSILYP